MAQDHADLPVEHNPVTQRFEIMLADGQSAYVEYARGRSVLDFVHTVVPPDYKGQGLAERVAKAALDYARAEGFSVVASCPFVALYVKRHKEYQDLLQS